jgi:hypothetical protein
VLRPLSFMDCGLTGRVTPHGDGQTLPLSCKGQCTGRPSPTDDVSPMNTSPHHTPTQRRRRVSWWRLSAYLIGSMGTALLALVVLLSVFGDAILNAHGKGWVERAIARAHPGWELRIGSLDYALPANRLIAHSVTLSTTNGTLNLGEITLSGVRWVQLLRGNASLADALARGKLVATNLDGTFPRANYGIRCTQLRASVPDSHFIADGTELYPLLEEEAFFASRAFRSSRFRIVVQQCGVLGIAYGELFRGNAFRARSVSLTSPFLEALINRDKDPAPLVESPLMVHEALAATGAPMQVDHLTVTNGLLRYAERRTVGAAPATLTFGAVNVSVRGIQNQGEPGSTIELEAQGDLMYAGTMTVQMSIPVSPPDFSFHYSGSLGAMDLTRLNEFLELAEQVRINSGIVKEAKFQIDVRSGEARGAVRAIYEDLEIAILDQQTGSEKGLDNRIASFLANAMKVRKSSASDPLGSVRVGDVNHVRAPDDTFLEFAWFALRSGVLDVISH